MGQSASRENYYFILINYNLARRKLLSCKWDEESLWGRPEDDSKTNTDSEAEDALEFMLAFA